ncbi:MAG: HesA/MoeB/ThiF family protein [Candidatus Bathyarchaeia archaeon]
MNGVGLNDHELERYSRQIMLDLIGYQGQVKLKKSKVCVIGLGGLGVPISIRLATMGVGHLRVVDRDVVSLSDLHRQYLYDDQTLYKAKVEAASERLSRMNPYVTVEPLTDSITPKNVKRIVKGFDVVLDGLDSIEARYLVNAACVEEKIPYVYGGAIQSMGNVTTILPGATPCLECFMPGIKDEWTPQCSVVGVFPPILDTVAAIEVSEAIRIITGDEPKLAGKLLFIDLKLLDFHIVEVNRYRQCPVCGEPRRYQAPEIPLLEEECARNGKRTFISTPKEASDIDIPQLQRKVNSYGLKVKSEGKLHITFHYNDTVVTVMKSGVIIVQTRLTGEKDEIMKEIYKLLAD